MRMRLHMLSWSPHSKARFVSEDNIEEITINTDLHYCGQLMTCFSLLPNRRLKNKFLRIFLSSFIENSIQKNIFLLSCFTHFIEGVKVESIKILVRWSTVNYRIGKFEWKNLKGILKRKMSHLTIHHR